MSCGKIAFQFPNQADTARWRRTHCRAPWPSTAALSALLLCPSSSIRRQQRSAWSQTAHCTCGLTAPSVRLVSFCGQGMALTDLPPSWPAPRRWSCPSSIPVCRNYHGPCHLYMREVCHVALFRLADRQGLPALKRLGCVARLRKGAHDEASLATLGFAAGDALCIHGADADQARGA